LHLCSKNSFFEMKIYKLLTWYPNMVQTWLCEVTWFNIPSTFIKTKNHFICVFEYTCTLHSFSQIYSNLPLHKMKWNNFFSNLLPRLYSHIICKHILWKSFKSLRWDTLKHAHPWKVVQCDTPKGVTIVCFHPYLKIPRVRVRRI
jgi:hypothetical protein